jgi:NAD(P)-dependent dehydrogenase (short-subunit alcohol dehydrogenase family)
MYHKVITEKHITRLIKIYIITKAYFKPCAFLEVKMNFLPMTLEGKSAIVTGASRGMGKLISLGLAHAGADLILASIEPEGNEEAAEQIRSLGREALPVAADVTRKEDLNRIRERCLDAYGKIDILVNNAGISPIYKRAQTIDEDTLDAILQINLKAVFNCSLIMGEAMREQKFGKIINIASVHAMEGSPRLAVYSAAKAGVVNLTRTLAIEWAPFNVNVNAVAPGYFEVGLGLPVYGNEKLREEVLSHIPMGRFGKKEEICGAVVFLASDSANYITGHVLMVDGGWAA